MKKELTAKLIELHVLDNLTRVVTENSMDKRFISKVLAEHLSAEVAETIIQMAAFGHSIPIISVGDLVYASIDKEWVKKDLGDIDVLLDKGNAFELNGSIYYLGIITGDSTYGEYSSYSVEKKITFSGVDDNLKTKEVKETISILNIIPADPEYLIKVLPDNTFHKIVGGMHDIKDVEIQS
tara:strand:- start:259 stop:801 length:543 start_codon:yes stop_codon:yes gene_type:complete